MQPLKQNRMTVIQLTAGMPLQTAITEAEAVVANPDSSQSEIESKLNALQNALDALIVDSGNLDKNNLPDGTYSILRRND